MTDMLGSFERMLERAVERPARRLFGTRLEPAALARAVARAMQDDGQVGPAGLHVPSEFEVTLNPADYRAFESWRQGLERELADFALRRARERGWRCDEPVRVGIASCDECRPGEVRVIARLRDRPSETGATAGGTDEPGPTVALPVVAPASRSARERPARAAIELADGRLVPARDTAIRIGRAEDNDVVLDHDSVSRHHAEVRWDATGWVLHDLGSRNGTRLGEQPIEHAVLRAGDVLYIGAVPVRFRLAR